MLPIVLAAIMLIAAFLPMQAAASAPASLKELGEAFVEVAEKVKPAVVNISSVKKMGGKSASDFEGLPKDHPFRQFFGDEFFKRFGPPGSHPKGFRRQGMGSGVVVKSNGTILTNAHVVKGADEIKVKLSDKRTFDAKVIGLDADSDIAVIKIDASKLPTAKIGDSDELRVGEIVLAVGNPFGLTQTVTSGIVSAKGRSNVGIIDYEDFIQTDAAINPGNSGGPLVNINGEVIGINTAIATRSGGYQGIGFAIPSNSAKAIMHALLTEGKVRRGLLGVNIQDLNPSLAKSFGTEDLDGALVSQVVDNSPAEKAGVKSGDIIVKFMGTPVSGAAHLKNLVGRVKPGTKAELTVFRKGKTLDIPITVGERDPEKIAAFKTDSESSDTSSELGIDIEPVPSRVAKSMGLAKDQGVRIKNVDPDGLGRTIGLRGGDVVLEVNGAAISDVTALKSAVKEAEKQGVIRVKVQRGKAQIYLAGSFG